MRNRVSSFPSLAGSRLKGRYDVPSTADLSPLISPSYPSYSPSSRPCSLLSVLIPLAILLSHSPSPSFLCSSFAPCFGSFVLSLSSFFGISPLPNTSFLLSPSWFSSFNLCSFITSRFFFHIYSYLFILISPFLLSIIPFTSLLSPFLLSSFYTYSPALPLFSSLSSFIQLFTP